MKRRRHGGRVFEAAEALGRPWREMLDFSANINPLGQPRGLKAALFRDFDRSLHYPEVKAESLARAVAETAGLSPEQVLPGAGSSPHLFLLCRTLDFQRPVIIGPAFAEYEGALTAAGFTPQYVLTRRADGWLVTDETVERAFAGKPGLVFLAHPANPTGRLTPWPTLERLADEAHRRHAWLIIDEAFIDFTTGRSALSLLAGRPRLIILRSLTKIFALPGLRLAWLGAAPRVIKKLRDRTEPWPLSSLAISAGHFCLAQKKDFAARTQKALPALRRRLVTGLASLKLGEVFPTEANFVLLKLADGFDPDALQEHLRQQGVLVRDASNFKGLGRGYWRLAVRPAAETDSLLRLLEHN